MKLTLSFFAFVMMVSSLTWAQKMSSCETTDFSEELGPVRDQGNIGWCYANAAADLLSFRYRKTWSPGIQASAIWIALGYNVKENKDQKGTYIFSGGGDVGDALAYAAKFDFTCTRILDNIFVLGGMNLQIKQKLHSLEELKSKYMKRNNSADDAKAFEDYVQTRRDLGSILNHISDSDLHNALELPVNEAGIEIATKICEPYRLRISFDKDRDLARHYKSHTQYWDDEKAKWIYQPPPLMELLNRQLDKDNAVGIGYLFGLISPDQTAKTDGHAGVIVGREFKNGSCLYKIRNSWGKGCGQLNETSKKFFSRYGPKVVKCEESGHVWVTGKDLESALDSITFFRP